ncbi:MAG: plastocyanin/azurin family copper-binding protein [Gemmatimonadaceae bacterium]
MRFYGIALATSAFVLAACGGGESTPADTAAATPAVETPAAAVAGTAAPITGTIHEVKMLGDEKGYRYEPATIVAKAGDGIKFIMVSGGPHNVSFDPATISADSKDQLMANMPNSTEGSSPMLMTANETWTLSLGNLKAGKYPFICTPHIAMGMKGELEIQ